MTDNTTLNPGTGGDVIATDDISGVKYQRIKTGFGADGVYTDVSASDPLPVLTGGLTDTQLRAAAVPVTGPLTNTQLRAADVPVSIANPVAVTGPLTNAELRAASVPVSGTFFQATQPVSGPLTNAEFTAVAATKITSVPDNQIAANPVRVVGQDIWNCSFSSTGASVLASQLATPIVGTGVGYSQASGNLSITTGTTTNAEFLTRSTVPWRSSMRQRAAIVASQRIANQNLAFILGDLVGETLACTINSATSITVTKTAHGYTSLNVGQFMFVGGIVGAAGVPGRYAIASVPDANTITFTVAGWPASGTCTLTLFGHSHVKTLLTGVTATNANFTTQRNGWADADTVATINTTASPGTILQVELDGRQCYLSDTLRATVTTPSVATRASRFENIPDDNLDLYLWIWNYNGTVAPASTTTWTISFLAVERFANTPVYIQGYRANGTANPQPMTVAGGTLPTVTTVGTVTTVTNAGTPTAPATPYFVNSAATTNGALILTGSSGLQSFYATNIGATAAYVKLYNKATAPTVGTDVPEMVIPIAAAVSGVPGVATLPIGFNGFRFALGLGIAITGAAADSDTTAVASGQVKVKLSRTI